MSTYLGPSPRAVLLVVALLSAVPVAWAGWHTWLLFTRVPSLPAVPAPVLLLLAGVAVGVGVGRDLTVRRSGWLMVRGGARRIRSGRW